MKQQLETLDDATLITMTLNGDAGCFAALRERHLCAVNRRVFAMTRNAGDADDLAQIVWFKAWKCLPAFRFESSFRTWLTRITINEVLQYHRTVRQQSYCQYVENLDELPSHFDSPHRTLEQSEAAHTVRTALARLPEKYREVLILHEFEQLSMREMARSVNMSVPAVKSRLFRARTMLTAKLDGGQRRLAA
jgi:RNA polymerase sigma-70 factor (ECF subfamily)